MNTRVDKDLFIQFIRKESLDNPVNLGDGNDDDDSRNDDRPTPGATPERPTPPTARSPTMRFFDANDFESSQEVEAANIRSE